MYKTSARLSKSVQAQGICFSPSPESEASCQSIRGKHGFENWRCFAEVYHRFPAFPSPLLKFDEVYHIIEPKAKLNKPFFFLRLEKKNLCLWRKFKRKKKQTLHGTRHGLTVFRRAVAVSFVSWPDREHVWIVFITVSTQVTVALAIQEH